MAQGAVEFRLIGDKELNRALHQMPLTAQGKVVRASMRKSMARVKQAVAAATPVDTGRLKTAIAKAKTKSVGKRGTIRIGFVMPTRDELGIPADAKGYYPVVLEYGSDVQGKPALRFIRDTTDQIAPSEIDSLSRDLASAITTEWARLATKWIKG